MKYLLTYLLFAVSVFAQTTIKPLTQANIEAAIMDASAFRNAVLPSQTSQAGKYLKTDGTSATWEEVTVDNTAVNAAIVDNLSATRAALEIGDVIPAATEAGTPAFAFALQRIVSGYIGPCVKIRRSSDNAETDIGFLVDGKLDTVSLKQYCGTGDGFIRTWYDQSGNARHLQQATTTKQFQVVASGAIVTVNGEPAADVVRASSQNMQASAFDLAGASAATVFASFAPDDTTTGILFDHGQPYTTGGIGLNVSTFTPGRIDLLAGSASAATRLINSTPSSFTAATAQCVSAVIDPARSTSDLRARLRWNLEEVNEGNLGVVGVLSTGCFLSDVLTVGSNKSSAGYYDGKIFGFGAWMTSLDASDLAAVETQGMRMAGLATPYASAPAVFEDTGTVTQDADFLRTSSLATSEWTTTSTVLKIHAYTNIVGSTNAWAHVGVLVNGSYYQEVLSAANGYFTGTVFLPSGSKTLKIVSSSQSRPGGPPNPVMGCWPVSFATNAPMNRVSIDQASGLVVYGDSIIAGDNASPIFTSSWPMLVRSSAPYPVGVEAWGWRALHDDAADAPAIATFVSTIAAWNPSKFWLAMGSNDYGLSRWSAANFGIGYAAVLDGLHAAMPDLEIYCQTPVFRGTVTANTFGSTLQDYRDQITAACATRPWTTLVDGEPLLVAEDMAEAGVSALHPTTAGHAKLADAFKTVLGID